MSDVSVVTDEYVRTRLARAVHALATVEGPLAERLFHASLSLATLRVPDFADDQSRAEFGAILEMLTRHDAVANEGRVRATLARISAAEARAAAERILDLDERYRPLSAAGGEGGVRPSARAWT